VDLLVLTSLDQLLLLLLTSFTFFTKRATRIRRSTVLSIPFQLVFPRFDKSNLHGQFFVAKTQHSGGIPYLIWLLGLYLEAIQIAKASKVGADAAIFAQCECGQLAHLKSAWSTISTGRETKSSFGLSFQL
jgi:hypothetical protein